jgi:DNA invertase Pin-like site-specific DNA recombinase
MGRCIRYACVSTSDQKLTVQKAALERDGCAIIFEDKRTGTKRNEREQPELALKVLTEGDTLVVTRLDRLGRSMRDLANIVHEIDETGANLRVIEQSVDTGTFAGRAFFGMFAVFAQFETDVRRERQAEGIERAKKAGVYTDGKPRIDRQQVRKLAAASKGPAAIAGDLGVSRMSVYRILREKGSAANGWGTRLKGSFAADRNTAWTASCPGAKSRSRADPLKHAPQCASYDATRSLPERRSRNHDLYVPISILNIHINRAKFLALSP